MLLSTAARQRHGLLDLSRMLMGSRLAECSSAAMSTHAPQEGGDLGAAGSAGEGHPPPSHPSPSPPTDQHGAGGHSPAGGGAGSRRSGPEGDAEFRASRRALRPLNPAAVANVSRSVSRRDLVRFFQGYNLSQDEVRAQFRWGDFVPEAFWVNFPTPEDRDRALARTGSYLGTRRAVVRKGTPQQFNDAIYSPLVMSSRGRYVLVTGIPDAATAEDVLRFFSGFDLHYKSVSFVWDGKDGGKGGRKASGEAVVRFATQEEAHCAVRTRQRGYCVGGPVTLRQLF